MSDSKSLAITLPLLTLATLAAAYFAVDGYKKTQQITDLKEKLVQAQTGNSGSGGGSGTATYEKKRISITRKPAFSMANVECALCEGNGTLNYDKPRDGKTEYACPVCTSKGNWDLKVPTGQEFCTYCEGLGKTSVPPKPGVRDIYNAKLCAKCNGKGFRKIRKKKTS